MHNHKLSDNEYILRDEDLPIKCQENFNGSTKCFEKSMREMVNKFPDMFTGERWNQWRETKQEEKTNDANNKSIGRESKNDWREQHLREYEDIPL